MLGMYRFILICFLQLCALCSASDNVSTEVIRYKNPLVAMAERYRKPVEISIRPSWALTERQLNTAIQPPIRDERGAQVRFLYPEDIEPNSAQVANGYALTSRQRYLMRQARRAALQKAVWQASIEAENYNRANSSVMEITEKKGLYVIISLNSQKGSCMDGEREIRSFRVCSGKSSTPTPKGHFHVMEKHLNHRSNLYNNAAMPFFMRLTADGVGLHQGNVRSVPSSHGCVRLMYDDARFLFEHCAVGTPVFVVE